MATESRPLAKEKTMSNIIDADTAKLAGLQIDLLQKMRQGQITLNHLEWFTGLRKEERDSFYSQAKSEKFKLFADLGTITVPEDLMSLTAYDKGSSHHAEFPNPTHVLKTGDKIRVQAWRHAISRMTRPEEWLEFLERKQSLLVGIQGALLVFKALKSTQRLPNGYWYASFDEKEKLFKGALDYYHVPGMTVPVNGSPVLGLHHFAGPWEDFDAVLSFHLIAFGSVETKKEKLSDAEAGRILNVLRKYADGDTSPEDGVCPKCRRQLSCGVVGSFCESCDHLSD